MLYLSFIYALFDGFVILCRSILFMFVYVAKLGFWSASFISLLKLKARLSIKTWKVFDFYMNDWILGAIAFIAKYRSLFRSNMFYGFGIGNIGGSDRNFID